MSRFLVHQGHPAHRGCHSSAVFRSRSPASKSATGSTWVLVRGYFNSDVVGLESLSHVCVNVSLRVLQDLQDRSNS